MTETTQLKKLDALKADRAHLREEIAEYVAGLKKATGIRAEQSHAVVRQEGPTPGEDGLDVWTDLLRKLDYSGIQGRKPSGAFRLK